MNDKKKDFLSDEEVKEFFPNGIKGGFVGSSEQGSGEYDSGMAIDSDGDPKWYNDIDDGMWNAPD